MRKQKSRAWVVMAVDLNANASYEVRRSKPFAAGQSVWVNGIEFTVVAVSGGQLILAPVNVNIG
jgi:hypothetical protein